MVGSQVARLHRHRQRVTTRIENRPATGGNRLSAQPLVDGGTRQGFSLNRLELHQSSTEDREDNSGRDEQNRATTASVG